MGRDSWLCLSDVEQAAAQYLSREIWHFIAGGSGGEQTLRANRAAFDKVFVTPRVMVDVERPDPSTKMLGTQAAMPVAIAPMAYHRLVHPSGEIAVARAARDHGIPLTVATLSSHRLEDVAAVGADLWFQLYWLKDRGQIRDLLRRAEAAGCTCVMLTVDTPRLGRRLNDMRNGFAIPESVEAKNVVDAHNGLAHTQTPGDSAVAKHSKALLNPALTWKELDWLRQATTLPVVLKGVLDPRDAVRAASLGVEALVVSNHGGRQFDGAPPALAALAEVLDAVAGRCEVFVDGGVRSGGDVLKALALGAKGVLVGRPVLYGLAVRGEAGVAEVLGLLRDELVCALALAGCPSLDRVPELNTGFFE